MIQTSATAGIYQLTYCSSRYLPATTAKTSIYVKTTWPHLCLPFSIRSRKTHMALNAYLKLNGSKQGEIKGSVTQKGREGKIMVIAANHEVVSPTDSITGLPTGKRQHKPFRITKDVDRSSPLLYKAMLN